MAFRRTSSHRGTLLKIVVLLSSRCINSLLVPQVLFESERVLAINKPTDVAHHNNPETGELGIITRLRQFYNNSSDENPRLYGVHRLDRVTTGILLLAKDAEMAGILSGAFRDNHVTKLYVGISSKKPKKKKQGWVRGEMVRGRRKSWYLQKETTTGSGTVASSDFAVTRFFTAGLGGLDEHLTARNGSIDGIRPRTCILFQPHTGKTHQLRVAAKSVGLPLLGDPIYGDGGDDESSRTFLHAAGIHIPSNALEGQGPITIWCPPQFAEILWPEHGSNSFHQILDNLLEKHCECPELLSESKKKETMGA
ncbi:RNA pseudouridine synthase HI_0042 [Seminavis robusta]|uniref:RNA pseudouridine synthase HI_0042 n=1 Tax=Seminavis robusta TaxID=568900 RepID=A0A9N8EIA2_9STRA|nr:RNA pseudouridine synthase HI_0042 [Seminavis robusta]|eukprot:Sro998_g229520.1 RNA pseudouridine synthase HI_0042 (309) ;mRNA; r:25639-26565